MDHKLFCIFIPGLFSTSLSKKDEPISLSFDSIFDYIKIKLNKNKIKNILDDFKTHDVVSNNILLDNIYNKLISVIKEISKDRYFIFTYDWRLSLIDTIYKFKKDFEALNIHEDENIIFISHSAGGIIGFEYLNNSVFKSNSGKYFNQIRQFITIGCPFYGSIKALAGILGILDNEVINSELIKDFFNSDIFKIISELIPKNYDKLFFDSNQQNISFDEILDNYAENLNKNNIISGLKFINTFRKYNIYTTHVKYVFIAGISTSSNTCVKFNVDKINKKIVPEYHLASGDGTVHLLESIPIFENVTKLFVKGQHSYLTEIKKVIELVKNECHNLPQNSCFSVSIDKIKGDTIYFKIFYISDDKYIITRFKTKEKVYLSVNKEKKKINLKIKDTIFFFQSSNLHGVLRFTDVSFYYNDKSLFYDQLSIRINEKNFF